MKRARLMARVTACWLTAVQPDLRRPTMRPCAAAGMSELESLVLSEYVVPERTPDDAALGKGRVPDQTHIPQFGSGSTVEPERAEI